MDKAGVHAALWILALLVCAGIAAAVRWLFGPMRPPAGYDVVPEEWTVEEAKRAMQREDH